jgi:hypothetical protein
MLKNDFTIPVAFRIARKRDASESAFIFCRAG